MGLNLESTISLNSANFERGMHSVKHSVADTVKGFVVGAIGVATIEQAFERTIKTAEELVNTSKRLGMTVEQVQLLRQAAKEAGTEMGTVSKALEKINLARAKALGGDKSAMVSFGALGVSKKDLETKRAADLFMGAISETVKKVSPEQIAAPLREVLGRGAGEGIAVLKTDFDELHHKMEDMGAIMSTEVAYKLHELEESLAFFGSVLIAQLAPAILWTAQALLKLLSSALQFAAWVDNKTGLGQAAKNAGLIYEQKGAKGVYDYTATAIGSIVKNVATGAGFGLSKEQIKASLEYAGVNQTQLQKDVKDSGSNPFTDFVNRMTKTIADMISGKIHPNTVEPDFSATADTANKLHSGRIESDSLVKVGNFLGSNIGAVHSAARMEQHAATQVALLRSIDTSLKKVMVKDVSVKEVRTPNYDFDTGILDLMNPPN